MRFWKKAVLFYLGGAAYMTLEFIWRGRSHGTMFLLGGLCFSVMGRLAAGLRRIPLAMKVVFGTLTVTALELITGLLFNQRHDIWDYRNMPFHFRGQICLNYTLLWMPLTLAGMHLHDFLRRRLFSRCD